MGSRGIPLGWRLPARALIGIVLATVLAQNADAQFGKRATAPRGVSTVWAASWEASPEQQRGPPAPLSEQTVRQTARVSLGGLYARITLSNEFGDKPLTIGAAHIALAGAGSSTQPGSDQAVTFNGHPTVTIPTGARVVSDPISMKLAPLSTVSVSLYFPGTTGQVTVHYFSTDPVYVAGGDQTAAGALSGGATVTNNSVLTGISVSTAANTEVAVALGDSLTTGFGSTPNAHANWPDRLAEILVNRHDGPPIGVVNAGIGGNRLLHDFLGPNAMSRFDRDVLAQPNAGFLIVLLGINDLGLPGGRNLPAEEVSYDQVVAGYQQLIERAHQYGIKVFIATIPPFGPIPERPGYYSEAGEAKRVAINQWIRGAKGFEGVIDFDQALKNPKIPNRLLPAYDSGDHLDPNDAGYKAMTDAIEMRLFQ